MDDNSSPDYHTQSSTFRYVMQSPVFFISKRDIVNKRISFFDGDVFYSINNSINDEVKFLLNIIKFLISFWNPKMGSLDVKSS